MQLEMSIPEVNTILKSLAKLPLEESIELWQGLQNRASAAIAKEQEEANKKEEPPMVAPSSSS